MKKTISLLLALLMVFAIACSVPNADYTKTQAPVLNEEPDFVSGEVVSGGNKDLSGSINIKYAAGNITKDGLELRFGFTSGSTLAGITEKEIDSVPAYQISLTDHPKRMKLSFSDIEFYEYAETNILSESSLIMGTFGYHSSFDGSYNVYLQLAENVSFSVAEEKNNLIILLSEKEEDKTEPMYYLTLDAYDEFQDGNLEALSDFEPTLCSDNESILLISGGYSDETDISNRKVVIDAQLNDLGNSSLTQIQKLSAFELPNVAQTSQPMRQVIGIKDGKELIYAADMENAHYLLRSPSGDTLYIRTVVPDKNADVEQVTKDEIWIRRTDEAPVKLDFGTDFYGITDAAYSHDGRYLAILDSSMDDIILYVYDTEQKQLLNMGEEGFGDLTAGFAWHDSENTLFAMTGIHGAMQLISCSFGEDNVISVKAIEEQPGDISEIAYADGYIYFINGETAELTRIDTTVEEPERKAVCPANHFAAAKDGKSALVLSNAGRDDQSLYNVYYFDFENDESTLVMESVEPETFGYLSASESYFIINAQEETEYPYAMYLLHSKEIVHCCDLASPMLFYSGSGMDFYAILFSADEFGMIPNSYLFTIE